MEERVSTKRTHREWRRLAKKERRKRLRRRAAAERDADAERLRAALEGSADYLKWLEQREAEEREQEAREKAEHEQREKLWLEEEVRAREEWQSLQERKQRARQLQLEQEAKIREEFEAKQEAIRRKQEEEKRKREEDIRKREQLLKEIDDYIDNGIATPEVLREVIDSQPGKEVCPFFAKTGACRYGDTCSRNHRRVCLSKVILVPGFYTHFSLEKNSAEYDTDVALEFESSETRQHFREFYKDVVPELESFGRIRTLKYCCNTEVHLRGNLYVEYYTEREAARALRRLKGRWYAGRRLNCEFVNLKSWRSAVCGMSKCPKGRACNFLHTFKNPRDEYDIKSPPRWTKQYATAPQEAGGGRKTDSRSRPRWEEGSDADDGKHWRWSESPEPEAEHRARNGEKRQRKSTRDRRPEQSDGERNADAEETPIKRRRLSFGKRFDEKTKDEDASNGREHSRRRPRSYQRKRAEDTEDERPRKGHARGSDRGLRSSSRHRSSKRHAGRREKENDRNAGRRRGNRDESPDDRTRRNAEDEDDARNARRVKSKWDKENSEQVASESPGSTDSDVSGTIENWKLDGREWSPRVTGKTVSDDEWATTDSESETTIKRKR